MSVDPIGLFVGVLKHGRFSACGVAGTTAASGPITYFPAAVGGFTV